MVLSVSRETVIFVAPRYPFIPDLIGVIASFLHPKDLVSFALLAKWYYQHITNEQSIFSRLPLKEQYKIFRKISKEWCDFIPTRPSRFFFFYYKNPLTLSTREALQALMNDNRESRNLLALQEVLNAHIEAFHDTAYFSPREALKKVKDIVDFNFPKNLYQETMLLNKKENGEEYVKFNKGVAPNNFIPLRIIVALFCVNYIAFLANTSRKEVRTTSKYMVPIKEKLILKEIPIRDFLRP